MALRVSTAVFLVPTFLVPPRQKVLKAPLARAMPCPSKEGNRHRGAVGHGLTGGIRISKVRSLAAPFPPPLHAGDGEGAACSLHLACATCVPPQQSCLYCCTCVTHVLWIGPCFCGMSMLGFLAACV